MAREFAPDVQQLLREQMAAGNYGSEDDLLRDALGTLIQRNEDLAAIKEGIADMEAGRTRPLRDAAEEIGRKYGLTQE